MNLRWINNVQVVQYGQTIIGKWLKSLTNIDRYCKIFMNLMLMFNRGICSLKKKFFLMKGREEP